MFSRLTMAVPFTIVALNSLSPTLTVTFPVASSGKVILTEPLPRSVTSIEVELKLTVNSTVLLSDDKYFASPL